MAGSLEFIKSASGTSVSSLSVTDCFSDKYDVYQVLIAKLDSTSTAAYGYLRFIDSGGSVISDSEYDYAQMDLTAYASFAENRNTAYDKGLLGYAGGTGTADMGGFLTTVYNPNDSSSYTFYNGQSSMKGASGLAGAKYIGVHKSAEQITGINILPASGSWDNITVNVYGLASN
jgi:hypothetical protein